MDNLLSEQAERLVEDFKKRIEDLPLKERPAVIKQMTEAVAALNKEAAGFLNTLREKGESAIDISDIDSFSDYI